MATNKNKKKYTGEKKDEFTKDGQSRSKKPYYKDKKKDKDKDVNPKSTGADQVCKAGVTNEPSWYNANDRLVQDSVKIPFTNQLGRPLDLNMRWDRVSPAYKVINTTVPGICVMRMINTPGVAVNGNDGANIAATMIFQRMRRDLSTYASYASADVLMYCLGIDNIYSQYANLVRLFGLAGVYSSENLYLPKAIIRGAYGFSEEEFDRFIGNLNDYRASFNNLIFRASTLYLPTDFSIVARHAWLYSNYFLDGSTRKSQIYIHRMMGVHKLNETLYKTGTALEYIEAPTTIDGLLETLGTCIEMYRNSDSMLKIAADMRRAYQESSAWQLAYVNETFMLMPTDMDDYLKAQIHNMDIVPEIVYQKWRDNGGTAENPSFGLHIQQDVNKNLIIFKPQAKLAEADGYWQYALPQAGDKILDFKKSEVTSDDILEATRNVLRFSRTLVGTDYVLSPASCGADICVGLDIISLNLASNDIVVTSLKRGNIIVGGGEEDKLAMVEAFAHFPHMFITKTDTTNKQIGLVPYCEFDNYSIVSWENMYRINNVVMCNMWSIPAGMQ